MTREPSPKSRTWHLRCEFYVYCQYVLPEATRITWWLTLEILMNQARGHAYE